MNQHLEIPVASNSSLLDLKWSTKSDTYIANGTNLDNSSFDLPSHITSYRILCYFRTSPNVKFMKLQSAILVILFNVSLFTSGQSLAKLDINNGFRKLKFGMTPAQIGSLELDNSLTLKFNGVKEYIYTGNDITDFYGVTINRINLSFFKNKLYHIMVQFGDIYRKYSDRDHELVDDALRGAFGPNTHNCMNSGFDEKLNCVIWDAKSIRLEHIRFNLAEPDGSRKKEFNYISGYILFIHKPIEREQQESEL